MKILLLPNNVASIPSITTEALNNIEGIKAVCITNYKSRIQSRVSNTIFIPRNYPRKKPFKWLYYKLSYRWRIKSWIKWADVIHYVWGPAFDDGKDVELAFKMRKPLFIEWLGSDIRNHEYVSQINKYYKEVFNNGYEYFELESSDHAKVVQEQFSKVKAQPILNPEMSLFLNNKLFLHGFIMIMPRINLENFQPAYSIPDKKQLSIIHSPSARVCKGTVHVLKAIELLKKKYEINFTLIENVHREKALELMSQCDIFIDQLILGSYGLASVEAMSFGKPVICYIMPEVYEAGLPEECPIVNANPDNLIEQLEKLIKNELNRFDIGKKSRAYVEKYHDAKKLAVKLVSLYSKALDTKNKEVK